MRVKRNMLFAWERRGPSPAGSVKALHHIFRVVNRHFTCRKPAGPENMPFVAGQLAAPPPFDPFLRPISPQCIVQASRPKSGHYGYRPAIALEYRNLRREPGVNSGEGHRPAQQVSHRAKA